MLPLSLNIVEFDLITCYLFILLEWESHLILGTIQRENDHFVMLVKTQISEFFLLRFQLMASEILAMAAVGFRICQSMKCQLLQTDVFK